MEKNTFLKLQNQHEHANNKLCLTVLKIDYVLSIFMYNGVIWTIFHKVCTPVPTELDSVRLYRTGSVQQEQERHLIQQQQG